MTEVVLALQPAIQQAVAAALAKQSRPAAPAVTSAVTAAQVTTGGDSGAGDNSATAEYSYEYKVSDKEQSTFISKQENRAGDTLTGSYSYVDPNGDLITVNYEAGAMGFSATTDKQEGFLAPARNSVSTSTASDYKTTSSGGLASSSAAVDQEALITRVLAALQPQISSAVAAAVSSSASAVSAPRGRSLARAAGAGASVESTFGEGISVSIDTPDFNIAY